MLIAMTIGVIGLPAGKKSFTAAAATASGSSDGAPSTAPATTGKRKWSDVQQPTLKTMLNAVEAQLQCIVAVARDGSEVCELETGQQIVSDPGRLMLLAGPMADPPAAPAGVKLVFHIR